MGDDFDLSNFLLNPDNLISVRIGKTSRSKIPIHRSKYGIQSSLKSLKKACIKSWKARIKERQPEEVLRALRSEPRPQLPMHGKQEIVIQIQ